MEFRVIDDSDCACPRCGAYWGHPDKSLDFPNRCKVDDLFRCYNPACTAGYYDPSYGTVVEDKLSPEAQAAMRERISREVADLMRGRKWVTTELANGISQSRLEPESYVLKEGER